MRVRPAASVLLACLLLGGTLLAQGSSRRRYLEDFEFVRDTVRKRGAAVSSKKIDWKAACARMRPLFAACKDDTEHVRNVMRLLAVLRDSHTGVTRYSVA